MLFSCKSEEKVNVKINRFDTELYQILKSSPDSLVDGAFQQKYAEFLPIYIQGVLRAQPGNGENPMFLLRSFFRDSTLMSIYAVEQEKFVNLEKEEQLLSDAMTHYKSWFPKEAIPEFSMHVSGLSQSVITTDKLVSISGDKYLGSDFQFYKSYFYSYQLPLMASENVVADAVKAFLQGRFPERPSEVLLDKMIYQGVLVSAAIELLPEEKESLVLGFTENEFDWLKKNEKGVWVYLIENEQLYSTDAVTQVKYMDEAPFTSYFGQNSPSRIGRYMGYRIVQSYLQKQNCSASTLLQTFDAQKVLSDSGYRP
ncbi:MAG: DUF2268 domain-containing putative Zn-dependent protease [Bacteroidales bacterium]